MSATVLEISNASRAFADREALQDVSLNVAAGEIVALLGPNGAGKTTLLRAVAGRLKLDSGSVLVMGKNPLDDNSARGALGIVPQTIALYPNLTARQNLDVFARLSGLKGSAIKKSVDEALTCAALQDRADDVLTDLSGGMQRRLNIVAGTLHHPKLLLLDEPTVGVDMQARESVHALLQDLRDAGMAILFITHDFDQAAVIAGRAAFMAQGKLLLEGSVAGLIKDAFGGAKEGVVELLQAATSEAQQILTASGLSSTDEKCVWSGPLIGGYADITQLEHRLETVGAHVAEIRVREPGLGGVFMQLIDKPTGQQNQPGAAK
jgi:ABC-2 type transport system ATP-binding protein